MEDLGSATTPGLAPGAFGPVAVADQRLVVQIPDG